MPEQDQLNPTAAPDSNGASLGTGTLTANRAEEAPQAQAAVDFAHPGQATASSGAETTQMPPVPAGANGDMSSKLPPVPPPESAQPPESSRHHTVVLLGLVGVLALAVAGVFAWSYMDNQTVPMQEDEAPVSSTPEPESTPEPHLQTPAVELSIDDLITEDEQPLLTGTISDPAAVVNVSINGVEYVTLVAEDGTWQAAASEPLAPGTYSVLASVVEMDGSLGASAQGELVVAAVAPPEVAQTSAPDPEPEPEPEREPEPVAEPASETSALPSTGPSAGPPPVR